MLAPIGKQIDTVNKVISNGYILYMAFYITRSLTFNIIIITINYASEAGDSGLALGLV